MFALAACGTYKPGAATQGNIQSIWVAPALNQSYMPQVAVVLSEHLRDRFMKDNLVRLVRRDAADATLEVTIVSLEREGRVRGLVVPVKGEDDNGNPTYSNKTDKGLYKAVDITLRAKAVLRDNASDKILFEGEFSAGTQTLPGMYISTSADNERMLIPVLARELARQIHDAVALRWDESISHE